VRILVLHPADSPRRGPWSDQRWDLIVDLGRSSEATAAAWQTLSKCSVVRLESYREHVEDPRRVGEILRAGFGQLLDSVGLDWWELTSLYVHSELEMAVAMRRLVTSNDFGGDLYSTRPAWPVSGLAALLRADVRSLSPWSRDKFGGRLWGYSSALAKLNLSQAFDVIGDKYDARYQWRSRFYHYGKSSMPVVLIPSAYTNVSRGAAGYAGLLPELNFLLVATRGSAFRFDHAPNVRVAHLAGYAAAKHNRAEYDDLLKSWAVLRKRLENTQELELLSRTGGLDLFPDWLRTGLAVRDAWNTVLDREPVTGVLCGDDSNWHTRLPVLLARKRNLPTIDFHHGALDGRFLMKELSSDLYLAKNEMERDYLTRVCRLSADRVVLGRVQASANDEKLTETGSRPNIVFFSEPFESVGGRPEEIYRELLPPLSRLALEHGRTLVVKLHPFENLKERRKLVAAALGSQQTSHVQVVSGALSRELLSSAWFGITVESSTVLDCTKAGVPCFHCHWLGATSLGYGQQFARFGIGRLLRSTDELAEIPRLLADPPPQGEQAAGSGTRPAAEILRKVFAGRAVSASR
jgi:hypothetical protein